MAWQTPTVRHLIACEQFQWDARTRKFSLRNVVAEFFPPQYPFRFEPLDVVVILSNGEGVFDFAAELVRVADQHRLSRVEAPAQTLAHRARMYIMHLFFDSAIVDLPGDYEVRLFVKPVRGPDGTVADDEPTSELATEHIRMEVLP